jgi:hypothetical protein
MMNDEEDYYKLREYIIGFLFHHSSFIIHHFKKNTCQVLKSVFVFSKMSFW